MKFEGRDSAGGFTAAATVSGFEALIGFFGAQTGCLTLAA